MTRPHDWPRRDAPFTDVLVPDAEVELLVDEGIWPRHAERRGPMNSLVFRDPKFDPHVPKRALYTEDDFPEDR